MMDFFSGMNYLLNFIILSLMILMTISFLTLLERKMLGSIQDRKGPNKVGLMGIFQPFSDGLKLLSKEMVWVYKSNYFFFILSPFFMMVLMFMMWMFYPFWIIMFKVNMFSLMMFICLLSLSVYGILFSGWASNSMYSMFGAMRAIAQSISYEVTLIFILMIQFFLLGSFKVSDLNGFQKNFNFFNVLFIFMLVMFIIILVDLNRTPFDLVEGESELVSGFNIEYMGGFFALIFLAEYGLMIFFCYFLIMMFFGWVELSIIGVVGLINLILWIRGILPRVRYDMLMNYIWKMILPFSMNFLLFSMIMSYLI